MLLRHWLDLLPVKLSWISRFGRLPGRHIRRLRRPAPFHVAADVLEARQLLSATAVDDHFVAEYNHLYNGIDLFVVDNDLSAAGATLELVGGATSTELTGAWGTLEVIDPGTSSPYIQFTPGSTYVSSFDFDYTVNDGSGASTGSVTVDVLSRQNGDAPVLDDEFTAIRVDDLFGTEGSDYEFLQNTDGLQLLNQRPLLAVAGSESGSIVGRNDDVIGDTRIVIDPTKSYTYSGWFRAGDDDPATSGTYNSNNRHYLGLNEYDFDGNEIHAFNVFQMAGSQKAVLKYDFDPVNDTVIVLEGTGLGWYDGSTANARNLGILNYQTSDGTVHEDYTRYVTWLKSTGLWGENAIVEDFVANETRITLNAGVDVMAAFQIYSQFQDTPPLTNGKFLAGTEVKNSRSSNANNYSLGANLNLDRDPGLASDDGWVYRVATIAGTLQPTSLTTYQFRPGTYSVSVRLRANSTASASAPDVLEYKDLRFGETDSLLVDPGDFSIQDNAIAQFAFDGNTSLSSLGPADFLADELIRIDPARPYALTLSLQSGNDTGGEFVAANAHYVGIAQYDQTGQFLGYAGKTITYTTQDWQQYTLLFSGVSETPNAQSNQLHPDAFFLRPVIEANSNGQASNRLQWRDVRITYAPNLLEGQTQALTFAGQTTYTSNSTHNYLYSDEYIAVRTDQHYQLSMEVQADDINSNGDAIHYFGFVSYDANFKRIDSFNFLKYAGSTDAQLAEDFDPLTDTEIVLQGTGLGWYNGSTGHMRNLSFLNYLSPDGTAYTDYSRYVTKATNGAWLAGSIVEDSLNNQTRITLTSDFLTYFEELPAGSLFAAGTTVRNARSGGTYNYALLANSTIPDDWTTYEATIGNGVMNGTTFDHSKFRPGTAFIKFIGLINWNDNADQTSVTSTQINLRNASITRVNHTNGTLTLNLDVLRNDAAASDPQSVTITGITQPEFGTASIDSGNGTTTHDTITYITDGWFSGTEILEYTFEEADGTEHIGTVRVNVLGHDVEVDQTSGSDWETLKSQTDPANNSIAPSGSDETYTVSYRDTLDADGVNLSGVLANDTIGDSDFVISRLTSGTQFGSLRLSADGTFEYIPLAGFLGVDYFTYEIFDGLHTSSSTVTIHVVDRVPIVDDQTFSVSENAQVNDVLGTIAVENDPGEELTYAILSGNENSIFGLDSNTGIVTVLDSASLDYETATSYSLAIEVTDPSGQSDTAILTITVDDENEAPVFEEIPDTLTLVDQVSNGTIIGRITASDPDATQSAISYSITGGTGQSAFTIDAATGEIQVSDNSSFDATTTPSLTLEVTATEAGSPGLSSSTTLTIQFSEVLPLVQDDYQVLQAGTWTTIDLLANDLGWDGVEFSISELAGELTPEVPVTLTYGTVVLQPKVSETLLNEFVIAGGFANYESLRAYVNERFGDDDLNSIDWFDESLDWTGVEDPLAEVEFDQQDNGFDYYYRQFGNPQDRGQYVLYYVSHDPNTTGQETFEYSVTDAVGRTAAATVTIEIVDGTPVTNAPPVPVADAYTVASDQVLEVAFADYGLLKNDVDRDGDSLQVTLVSGPLNGQLTLQSDGTFSYTPDAGFSGFDSFQYTVNDGTNPESAPQTVQLLVSQGLLTPDALAIDVKVGATAWIDPLADLELEFDTPGFLQLIDVSGGISGTAVVTYAVPISLQTQYESSGGAQRHGSLETFISTHYGSLEAYIRSYGSSDDALALGISYTNSTLAAGQTEDLTYVLRDAQGHLLFGTLTVTGVATSNSAPVAGDDDLIMDRDGFLRFDPRDLDTDADGDELVYTILDEPQHGTLTEQIDGSLIYRPDLGHEGIETLTYEVSDGVLSDTGTITITVRHGITTNNAPALEDQAVNLSEDATLGTTVVVGNLASDADLDTLTYRIASGNSAGLFAIDSASGEITLASTDGLDWETTDSYTLMVEVTDDGFPNVSTSAEYLITILDANDAPIVNSETFILSEDAVNGTSVGTVSGTDADAGQSLTYSIMAGNTNNTFAIDATTGEITLTDATQLQYGTNYSLTVQATDDDVVSPLSGTGTISILIAGVGGNANSAPVLNDDTFTLAEDAAGGTLITTLSASDADAGDSLSYRIVSGNEYGDFQLDSATGALTVTPDAPLDFETISTYTLIIEVRDNGLPALTDTATITITLDDVNEAPTILTETLSMLDDLEQNDAVGKILATDVDAGATLTYAIVTDSSGGLFAIDANTGEVTVASATPGFDAETTPEYTLEIQVSDGTNATTETVMIEVVEQTKAAAQKTLEELLGYAAFAEDVFEAPVTLPGLGLIPEFESAQMGEYLPEFISEWTLAETYPGTTSVGLTTTSLDETIATELVTLTIGTLSIDQVIDGDRTAVGSYTDADNWSYTETVDRLITWDLSYDSNGLSLVATRTRSDQFNWTIEMIAGVFSYTLERIRSSEAMREDTFVYDLSGQTSTTDEDGWVTTVTVGNSTDTALPDTYHATGTQSYTLEATGSRDETGSTPVVTDSYDLEMSVSGDYEYVTTISTHSPLEGGTEPSSLIVSTDSASGQAEWSFVGSRTETGDGTDLTSFDESYTYTGSGDDTYELESSGMFDELETSLETVSRVIDEETEETEEVDYDVTTHLLGTTFFSDSGTAHFEFELAAEQHLDAQGLESESVEVEFLGNGTSAFEIDDQTTTSITSIDVVTGDITEMTLTDLIRETGSLNYFVGSANGIDAATGSSELTTLGESSGSASSYYAESGNSTFEYDLSTDIKVYEDVVRDGNGAILSSHLVLTSQDRLRTATPDNQADSYILTDLRTATRDDEVDTGTFDTYFDASGHTETLTYFYEQFTPQELNEIDENGDPLSTTTATETVYDYSSGTDSWSSISTSGGDFEINADTGYSRITTESTYDDQSSGSYDYATGFESDITNSTFTHYLPEGADPGDPLEHDIASVTQYETFFEGTLDLADPASLAAGTTTVIDLDGNPVTSGPVSWSSSASGNGLFEVITEAFDVDEDGTIEEGEQQATTRIESYDDYDSDSSVAGAGVFTSYLLDVIATDEDNTDPDLDINTSGWETYWESGYLQTIEEAHGFVDLEITDTQTTETDWEDELAELLEPEAGRLLPEPEPDPENPEPEPTDTAVVTLISDDYYRFDDIYNYSYESVTGSSYTERGVGNQNRVHYATGEGEAGLNSQSHSWYLETLSVDEDETIDAYTESGVTYTTTGVRNTSESLRSYEGPLSENTIMISRFNSLTGFTSTENQFSFAHTVASKPPKVVNQQTGELEADPAADADGYVYEMSTGSSASILESGTTNYQTQETYQYYKITEPEPDISETRKTQNAWSNGIESYYLAAGGGTTVVNDLVTSTSYSRYDIPFSTGFSTYDSNSTSSSGDDSTTSVSHVETTTTETMTSGSTAKSRSGKDDQGRPFTESRNIEQFDRFTTELTIDYGHVIDKEGSHELPTFYDTETFEAIDYESNAISTNTFSLPNGARNSQSQYERTTSDGYSTTTSGTGQNRAFDVVAINTDGQVGLDMIYSTENFASTFWQFEDETNTNNGRTDHHTSEDWSYDQSTKHQIHEMQQTLTTNTPGTFVDSASGGFTRTLTAYRSRDVYHSDYYGGQNQIELEDGYEINARDNLTYQLKINEAEYPDGPYLPPPVTVDTEESYGGDFEGSGTIDSNGDVVWTNVESEARYNDQTYSGNSSWDPSVKPESYSGNGFEGTLVDFSTVGAEDLHVIWATEIVNPILDNLQQVGLHNPEYAAGRENSSEYVTEQNSYGHEFNYQFSTPPADEDGSSSTEPASEPTEGESTEGEECNCACGEGLSPALTAIHTYEIWDDGGTPEFPDDDVLIGYAVTEFYGEPWGNTTIYDRDGNEVEPDENGEYPTQYNAQNSDWRLINEETFGTTGGALAIGNSLSKEPKHPEYQISEIAAKITELAVKLAEFIVTGNIELEAGVSGKVSKKAVFDIIKKKLRALTIEKLVQIHHVIPLHFFKDGKFAKFFEEIGVNKNTIDNLIPLPTKEAKKAGLFGNMSGHWGNHLGGYYDNLTKKILNIKKLYDAGAISKEEAASLIKNLQFSTKEGLIDGSIKLQNEEAWAVLIPFAMAGMTKEEQEIFAEAIAEQLQKEVEKALTANECLLFRVQTYTGKEGLLGWLGFGADLFNPIDDIATLEDVLILLTFDPTKETGEQFIERMRRLRREIHERHYENNGPWGPHKL